MVCCQCQRQHRLQGGLFRRQGVPCRLGRLRALPGFHSGDGLDASIGDLFRNRSNSHDVFRGHFLFGIQISVPKPFRVYNLTFYRVDYRQTNSISWQHEVIPNAIMQVPVVLGLELDIPGPLHWVIIHRAITFLHWFVFALFF